MSSLIISYKTACGIPQWDNKDEVKFGNLIVNQDYTWEFTTNILMCLKEKEGPGLWLLGCFDPSDTLWSCHGGQVLYRSKSTSIGDYVNPKV